MVGSGCGWEGGEKGGYAGLKFDWIPSIYPIIDPHAYQLLDYLLQVEVRRKVLRRSPWGVERVREFGSPGYRIVSELS
jgi:hypothetical protein